MGIPAILRAALLAQRGQLFPFVPVLLGVGIGLYFALMREPPVWVLAAAGAGALVAGLAARRAGPLLRAALWSVALVAAGVALAGARAHLVAGPVLDGRFYGAVEGRVVAIDRSASDALRVTLDRVVLYNRAPERTPRRVRVALHGDWPGTAPVPGMTALVTAHLAPPGGPVEPGGFDFRRHAWFLRLGAVGYARTPLVEWAPPGRAVGLHRLRHRLSERIRQALPGERGAFAAAVLTGDRSAMTRETLDDLRHSNLAHLLAISGLHMGLLAGFVFAGLRLAQAAVPRWSDRAPAKKIAAVGALAAAAVYLALSGGNVATERAFVMVAVALGAVLADRRALSLRAVALAALIVLVLRPEALLGPGFQMSFAATTALVTAFGLLRDRETPRVPRVLRPVGALLLSSSVAGAATAPIAAAHFNIIAQYGLIANLLAVPLMGTLVIPAGVVTMILMPLGLDAPALWLMGQGIAWILGVAARAAEMAGAVRGVPSPGPAVLPLIALGGSFVMLWQGRARLLGLALMAAALALWAGVERPAVLVAEDGRLVGVMTAQGRALSRERGSAFAAAIWLENDGDVSGRPHAASLWPPEGSAAPPIHHVRGKRALAAFRGCAAGDLLVASVEVPAGIGCTVLDAGRLGRTGSVALLSDGRMLTAKEAAGVRLWNEGQ